MIHLADWLADHALEQDLSRDSDVGVAGVAGLRYAEPGSCGVRLHKLDFVFLLLCRSPELTD